MFFFNDPATPEIYTLSLHDALPIYVVGGDLGQPLALLLLRAVALERLGQADRLVRREQRRDGGRPLAGHRQGTVVVDLREAERSEEHTSELQSRQYLVCRLLLEKKK